MPRTKKSDSSRTLPPWKRVVFRALAMFLPILGLEAAARVYWVQAVEAKKTDQELYEEVLGEKVVGDQAPYQFFPNQEFTVASTPTKTNNLALRGDYDVDLNAPYAGLRVLCVGDSVTFGYTVSGNASAYPAVLERLLQQQGMECQVLNAGMPRYRMDHLAILFDDHLRHYAANVMVVLGGWNNANDRVLRPVATRSWNTFLNEHWYLLKVVRHLDFLPRWGSAEHLPARIEAEGYEHYADALRRIIASARAAKVEPVLCTLPHFFHHLDSDEAREKAATFTPLGTLEQLATVADTMNATIREVGRETGVPVIELGTIDQHGLFADAIHPNDAGSAAVAERVAEHLLRSSRQLGVPSGQR